MAKCIDSLLVAGEDAQIVIIDDGSKDNTGAIADGYAARYPSIVEVVHQENGGHGEGINQGILHATGLYFKVVDSDDYLDAEALKTLLARIKAQHAEGADPDCYLTNFVYDHALDGKRYVSHYRKEIKVKGELTDFSAFGTFHLWKMLLMHSITYKTSLLHDCKVVLPKHTFYEDIYFAFYPLAFAEDFIYLDVNLYYYFIGRADQSVTVKNMVSRYRQQIKVMHLMSDSFTYDEIAAMPRGKRKFLMHALKAVLSNTVFFICGENTGERKQAYKDFFAHIRERDEKMYRALRYRSYPAVALCLPFPIRGKVLMFFYKLLCKIAKLG